MRITEIFHSIQGESSFVGQPCVFVRLTGCPLRCTWCDTAYSFYGGEEMTLDEVVSKVQGYGCALVEVTGGEPLAQPEAYRLLRRLCDLEFTVLLETSGAADVAEVDRRVRTILDVKCPGSGMSHHMRWENLDRLQATDEIKFVLNDRIDYEWARAVVTERGLAVRHAVHFSPVFGRLEYRTLAEWILADRLPVRFQAQLHKLIWAPDLRGV